MNKLMLNSFILISTLLTVWIGCGGGSSSSAPGTLPPPAPSLSYTDPPSSGGYRLVKDAASTPSKLVLNLMGPSGQSGKGIGFTFSLDANALAWAKVAESDVEFVQNGIFPLGTGTQVLKSLVTGGDLLGAVFQKSGSATAYTGPLTKVAITLKSSDPNTPRGNVSLGARVVSVIDASGNVQQVSDLRLGVLVIQ